MNNGFINSSSQSISHGTISRSNQTPNGLDKLWLVCYFCCLTQTAILELKMQYSSILRITFFSLCDGPSDKRQCLVKSYVSRHLEALCLIIARIDRIIISWNEDCFKNWMTLIIFFFFTAEWQCSCSYLIYPASKCIVCPRAQLLKLDGSYRIIEVCQDNLDSWQEVHDNLYASNIWIQEEIRLVSLSNVINSNSNLKHSEL